jgi:hypothetical protein
MSGRSAGSHPYPGAPAPVRLTVRRQAMVHAASQVALEPTICPSRVADTLSTTTRRVSRELEQQVGELLAESPWAKQMRALQALKGVGPVVAATNYHRSEQLLPICPSSSARRLFRPGTRLVAYRGRFDGFHALPASVSKTCLVRFDNNKYSVNASAVGRPVELHAGARPRAGLRRYGDRQMVAIPRVKPGGRLWPPC